MHLKNIGRQLMARKSCTNCAYFVRWHCYLGEDYEEHDWLGIKSRCDREMWHLGFQEDIPEANMLVRAYTQAYLGVSKIKTMEDLEKEFQSDAQEFGLNFSATTVPLSDGEWHDLAKHKCQYYFPEEKRGTMSREKCWEEQRRRMQDRRFWIPTIISAIAILIAAISLWRTW